MFSACACVQGCHLLGVKIPKFSLIFQLLEKKKRVQLKDMGEDLECLCQIMRTVGPRLDHAKAKVCACLLQSLNTLNFMVKPLVA